MNTPRFMPWIWDCKEAWELTLKSPKYYYEMPFNEFLEIYQSYRTEIINKKGSDAPS